MEDRVLTEEKKERGYYDFVDLDLEAVLIESGMVDQMFYLRDLQRRKFILNTNIDQFNIADIVRHILQINREDAEIPPEERKPILLYIASNGGDVDAGFELIDAIECSKTPVYTINMGYQYSMGFLIGLAGHKRFAMKHAKYLHHDGSSYAYNSGAKLQDQMKFQERVEERIKEYVMSHSRLTAEEYESKFRVEWYMFADEAKEKGFVDYIVGVDCEIDAIV